MGKEEKIRTILFARWLSTCFADEHLDKQGRHSSQEGFAGDFLSVLNMKDSLWYLKQLEYFNKTVLPNYKKNGTYKIHLETF